MTAKGLVPTFFDDWCCQRHKKTASDRYAELSDVIYLIDYKTGKKEVEHQKQVQTYANALKEMTDKEIRAFLVYLSEDGVEPLSVNAGQ